MRRLLMVVLAAALLAGCGLTTEQRVEIAQTTLDIARIVVVGMTYAQMKSVAGPPDTVSWELSKAIDGASAMVCGYPGWKVRLEKGAVTKVWRDEG